MEDLEKLEEELYSNQSRYVGLWFGRHQTQFFLMRFFRDEYVKIHKG